MGTPSSEFIIDPLTPDQFDRVWPIFHAVISAGKTYSYPPDMTFEQARDTWCADEKTPFLARAGDEVGGTFY